MKKIPIELAEALAYIENEYGDKLAIAKTTNDPDVIDNVLLEASRTKIRVLREYAQKNDTTLTDLLTQYNL